MFPDGSIAPRASRKARGKGGSSSSTRWSSPRSSSSSRPTASRWSSSPRHGTNVTRGGWLSASAGRCSRRARPRRTWCESSASLAKRPATAARPRVAAGRGRRRGTPLRGGRQAADRHRRFPRARAQRPRALDGSGRSGDPRQHARRLRAGVRDQRVAAGGVTREQFVERLRRLISLPVEFVLPTHGAPMDRARSRACPDPRAGHRRKPSRCGRILGCGRVTSPERRDCRRSG